MQKIWYISPSNQDVNLGIGDYGSEQDQMYLLALEITPHLDRAGVSFVVPEKTVSLTQRVKQSNEMGAAFHLALHSNAGGNGNAWGPVGLYYSDTGKAFCEKLVDALLGLGQKTNRSYHIRQEKSLYELRKTAAPAALLEVDFHDSETGADFITRRRNEIAKAIAKVIIAWDGREFVPETPDPLLDEAIKQGYFGKSCDWDAPMTNREAAILAMKLKRDVQEGVKK